MLRWISSTLGNENGQLAQPCWFLISIRPTKPEVKPSKDPYLLRCSKNGQRGIIGLLDYLMLTSERPLNNVRVATAVHVMGDVVSNMTAGDRKPFWE